MADIVKPLKLEITGVNGGVQTDEVPTEVNLTLDYLGGKGVAFEAAGTAQISGVSGVMNFQDSVTTSAKTLTQLYTAINNTFSNATNGWVATNVQAAIEEAPIHLRAIEVSSTATATSTTSEALMTTMSISPTAGTYMAWFSCDINSGSAGDAISVSFYVGGTQVAQSLRKIIPFSGGTLTSGSGRGAVALNGLLTVTSGQAVEVHWSSSTAGATAAARTLNLLRIT